MSDPSGSVELEATVPGSDTAATDRTVESTTRARRPRPNPVDLLVVLGFWAVAVWLLHGLWASPSRRGLAHNLSDQALDEWFLALGPRLWHGDTALVTHLINMPDGINLVSNASLILPGLLLAPVTVLFGAPVSFALTATGNLALTGIAWYLLFSRTLGLRRALAATGAGLCAFAPGMVSQTNSHLHITAQWLVPAIAWCVLTLVRAAREPATAANRRTVVASGAGLGALVVAQYFLGEEVLFLTALTLALVTVCYAARRPAEAFAALPRFAGGLLLATGVAVVALAYPLWLQFAGPQHVPNGPFSPAYFYADLASFPAISRFSLAGGPASDTLTTGPAEFNTFFGWPLIVAVLGAAVALRRQTVAVVCGVPALVMCWLALGPHVTVAGTRVPAPAPYQLLRGLPVVDGALPSRFALAAVPLMAILLMYAAQQAWALGGRVRALVPAALAVALVPIVPLPLPTASRPPVPTFITGGHWRTCVRPGGVLVPVPLPTPTDPDTMRWAAATSDAFAMPEGFFIAPYAPGGRASVGTYQQPTSRLLADVARTGQVPRLGPAERAQAAADLRFWRASCLALVPGPHADAVRVAVERLIGPGERVADLWVWRVST
ncbi:MAG TPA: hypothetical protein VF054_03100 [Micromonosporaceae bacterium]